MAKAGAAYAKQVGNWMLNDMARLQAASGRDIEDLAVRPEAIADLIDLVESRTITSSAAKTVFERMFATGASPRDVVAELGLTPIGGDDELMAAVDAALAANPKAVADFRSGKAAALQSLVGGVMKQTRGRANPERVRELLQSRLNTP